MTALLVAYATRMGGTAEIAAAVADVLRERGLAVTLAPCDTVRSVEEYDAVVVGSAVYLGRWQHDAVSFLERLGPELAGRPTWLFQSGPLGEQDEDEGGDEEEDAGRTTPRAVARLARRFGLEGPTTFGGRLDPSAARDPVSRWMAHGELAGDFRDWDAIRAWADSCAHALAGTPPHGMSPELAAALPTSTQAEEEAHRS